jgi:hypothetical protein
VARNICISYLDYRFFSAGGFGDTNGQSVVIARTFLPVKAEITPTMLQLGQLGGGKPKTSKNFEIK